MCFPTSNPLWSVYAKHVNNNDNGKNNTMAPKSTQRMSLYKLLVTEVCTSLYLLSLPLLTNCRSVGDLKLANKQRQLAAELKERMHAS
jgi:hypothetical protein